MQRVYGGIGMNPVGRGGADEGGRRELTPGFPVEWHRVSQPASTSHARRGHVQRD